MTIIPGPAYAMASATGRRPGPWQAWILLFPAVSGALWALYVALIASAPFFGEPASSDDYAASAAGWPVLVVAVAFAVRAVGRVIGRRMISRPGSGR